MDFPLIPAVVVLVIAFLVNFMGAVALDKGSLLLLLVSALAAGAIGAFCNSWYGVLYSEDGSFRYGFVLIWVGGALVVSFLGQLLGFKSPQTTDSDYDAY